MRVVAKPSELRAYADGEREAGRRVALVPTMGALHAGHLALVAAGRRRADVTIVSIFVNPTQFGPGEDLEAYPRPLAADLEKCQRAGVDVVFRPDRSELYPSGSQTFVEVTDVQKPLCGASRPGHFRGVATVVCKLFLAAKPHVAVFGEKDFQQLALIRRMVRDLGFDVEIVGVPTLREPDGLALSSRNQRLTKEARRQALALPRALDAAERSLRGGCRGAEALLREVSLELAKAPLGAVDYAELRDVESLEPAPNELAAATLLALAVRFPAKAGGAPVRLIDNRVLDPRDAGRAGTGGSAS